MFIVVICACALYLCVVLSSLALVPLSGFDLFERLMDMNSA